MLEMEFIKCSKINKTVYLNTKFIKKMEEHDYHGETYIATDFDGNDYWVYVGDNEWFFGCKTKEATDTVFLKHKDYEIAMKIK